ncbi:MAG: chromosome condensation regulator RCC1 [Gemmatimonadetes bacterium]|nr:chromosome condensation regulator RCC1 [Gemmatimonadota bacterium]
MRAETAALPSAAVTFQSTGTGFVHVVQVAAGDWHTCALVATGAAFCWGDNQAGQLGDGSEVSRLAPVPVAGDLLFSDIGIGEQHTCALVAGGDTFCWGRNGGNLGDGTRIDRNVPTRVLRDRRFRNIAIAGYHNCAIDAAGQTYCWTETLGIDGPTLWPSPVAFVAIERNALHTCGLTAEGAAYCWGENNFNGSGQLGDGTTVSKTTPTAVVGNHRFKALALGFTDTCGIDLAGAAHCWGYNHVGQVGDGTQLIRLTPVPVLGGHAFKAIAGGNNHMCGLDLGGLAHCWGGGAAGQLGNGNRPLVEPQPRAVAGGIQFVGIATAGVTTCAWTAAGTAYCWGFNNLGQVGDGTTTDRLLPTRIDQGQ